MSACGATLREDEVMRKKNGPALFEFLSEEAAEPPGAPVVARRWRRSQRAANVHRTGAPSVVGASGRRKDPDLPERATDRRARLVELDVDRVRLTFTSTTAAVAIFAGLAIAYGVYEIGRRAGEREGMSRGMAAGRAYYEAEALGEIEAARRQPPATELVSSLLADGAVAAEDGELSGSDSDIAAVADGPHWVRDYTYVVVQEFSPGYVEDAARARAFVAERAVATEVVPRSDGGFRLITIQGYDRKDPTQREMADRLKETVHRIGAEYFASGGGYRLEGYFKTLKGDSW